MELEERVTKLERRWRWAIPLLSVAFAVLGASTAYEASRVHALETKRTLRVKELRVYDDKGVDRVVIAGRLPQAMLDGKPHYTRIREMGGMLIYDGSGTERGGYGTMDGYANAILTLDAKDHQVFLALAEPPGGFFMRGWEGPGSVTMGAAGKPFLTLMNGKDVVFAAPKDNPWTRRGQSSGR
jgi:hypothetical protein